MTREELQAKAELLGFDLVGIAPGHEFPTVPAWVGSVVVLGMAVLDPAYDLELYIEAEGRQRFSKWAYERMVAGAARLALVFSATGRRAEPLAYENSLATLDLKAAAVRAGLGVWGLNNLVITRRFGPRVRFGAVLVEAGLPADQPLQDYYCVSCSLCLAACPTGALGPGGLDRSRCVGEFAPSAAMVEMQRTHLQFPTPHAVYQCTRCISACPIGKRLHTRFWGLDPH